MKRLFLIAIAVAPALVVGCSAELDESGTFDVDRHIAESYESFFLSSAFAEDVEAELVSAEVVYAPTSADSPDYEDILKLLATPPPQHMLVKNRKGTYELRTGVQETRRKKYNLSDWPWVLDKLEQYPREDWPELGIVRVEFLVNGQSYAHLAALKTDKGSGFVRVYDPAVPAMPIYTVVQVPQVEIGEGTWVEADGADACQDYKYTSDDDVEEMRYLCSGLFLFDYYYICNVTLTRSTDLTCVEAENPQKDNAEDCKAKKSSPKTECDISWKKCGQEGVGGGPDCVNEEFDHGGGQGPHSALCDTLTNEYMYCNCTTDAETDMLVDEHETLKDWDKGIHAKWYEHAYMCVNSVPIPDLGGVPTGITTDWPDSSISDLDPYAVGVTVTIIAALLSGTVSTVLGHSLDMISSDGDVHWRNAGTTKTCDIVGSNSPENDEVEKECVAETGCDFATKECVLGGTDGDCDEDSDCSRTACVGNTCEADQECPAGGSCDDACDLTASDGDRDCNFNKCGTSGDGAACTTGHACPDGEADCEDECDTDGGDRDCNHNECGSVESGSACTSGQACPAGEPACADDCDNPGGTCPTKGNCNTSSLECDITNCLLGESCVGDCTSNEECYEIGCAAGSGSYYTCQKMLSNGGNRRGCNSDNLGDNCTYYACRKDEDGCGYCKHLYGIGEDDEESCPASGDDCPDDGSGSGSGGGSGSGSGGGSGFGSGTCDD